MKLTHWLMIIYYHVLVKKCYATELKIEVELTNYSWKNMVKVQSFFLEVFPVEYQLQHFVEMMNGDLVKLAFHGKKLIGFLYSHTDFTESNVFVVASIGCLPSYRRQGVGSYLLEYALNYAKEKGSYNIIRLYVQTSNNVALKFYKKYGFKIVKEEPDYYINTIDTNAYKMEKMIYPLARVNSSTTDLSLEENHTIKFRYGSKSEQNLSSRNSTEDARLKFAMKLKEILKQKFD